VIALQFYGSLVVNSYASINLLGIYENEGVKSFETGFILLHICIRKKIEEKPNPFVLLKSI
jgi:hypothetical protein